MFRNQVHRKIKQGEPAFGVFVGWPSPDLIEFCGYLGFEWVFIDAEHGSIGRESCELLVRACQITGITPVVRVPENNAAVILSYLEAGALGIIVPHVNSAADAQAAVDAVKYGPLGQRGAGSTTRVANYGLTQTPTEYFRQANEETMVIALVEEIEGVGNLDEILAVDGLDVVGIGPGDLAMTLGLPGQISHPEVRKLVDEAEAKIVASGKALDAVVADAAGAQAALARGALLIAVSSGALLGAAGRSYLEAVREPGPMHE
jgi:4-hydroxy-2-oxoheptanedioate aldolase